MCNFSKVIMVLGTKMIIAFGKYFVHLNRQKTEAQILRFGALGLVAIAAFVCAIYMAGNSEDVDRKADVLVQQMIPRTNPLAAEAQHVPVVTVRAFVAPKGEVARALPTVPVLAAPLASASRPAAPVLAVKMQAPKVALSNSNPSASAIKSKLDDEEEDGDESQSDQTQSPTSPALSTQSMDELYREVKELEQQERRAMATRAAALQKAMAGTSNCGDGDAACGQANLDVKWKSAKDKYEQVASDVYFITLF